jgi:hypothetical protein
MPMTARGYPPDVPLGNQHESNTAHALVFSQPPHRAGIE